MSAWDGGDDRARLLELGEELVRRARAAGADEAEACLTRGESTQVHHEKGELKLTQVDDSTALGLRVLVGGRQGFAATNQTDPGALQRAVDDALALARLSPPDEHNGLPEAAPLADSGDAADAPHPELVELPIERVVELGRDLVGRVKALDPRLSLDKAEASWSRSSSAVVSSAGARAAESDASVSASVFGMAVDGDQVGGFDYWGGFVRDPAGLEDLWSETARRFAEGALGNLSAGRAESYRGPVLFSPAAFLSVFVSPLAGAASALAVQRGRSALAGKRGEPVAAAGFRLLDDPTDAGLSGAARFDREGLATAPFELVRDGVLGGYLHNGYSARVAGERSTAHAQGGTRSVPGLGAHALVVGGGDGGDAAALRASLGQGLVVQRFSGTVDPASGDFSGVAKSARWVEGGEVVRSVQEVLIAGNAFELLRGNLTLGSEAESVMGSARSPWALVDGLSVTAG